MIFTLVKNEFLKEKRNLLLLMMMLLPIGIAFLLVFDLSVRYESWLLPNAAGKELTSWNILIKEQRILYFNDFMPLFAAIILGQLFETEYKNNGWTLTLTKPIKMWQILFSKYITALIILIMMLVINIIALIMVGKVFNFPEAIPWDYFLNMMAIQLVASSAVMIIQLFFSIKNKNVLISFGIAALLSILSSNIYYNENPIRYFNPYNYAMFSITQERQEIIYVSGGSAIVIVIGAFIICKYFKFKKIY
ncbi:ABC transporter permease [Clostridium sp. LIBA-8841]|uniref:ABC transporter permease n=1 Tax=Clostridium sp. LIBA-8841 TaxID=2987530 RepID=UPI002AC57141|nr:ABC transporter permease [Clostridium sp. LIBA-8841]MDZ5254038.1 ABC transporter permease [Clostridium sp. LIBA-8841]